MTLLVVAALEDPVARALVQQLRAGGTASELLLATELTRAGWRLELGGADAPSAQAVLGDRRLEAASIRGVVTRLWAVTAQELPFIHADDRTYAAAEMHAFLLAFLASLRCPVLNAPSPGCLAGPALSPEQWLQIAAAEQIQTRAFTRHYQYCEAATAIDATPWWTGDAGPTRELTVVGQRCFGDADAAHLAAALRLARAAGVELLRVIFGPGERGAPLFLHADYWIDAANPAIAGAIRERCAA